MKRAFLLIIPLILLASCSFQGKKAPLSCELFYISADENGFVEYEKAKLFSDTTTDATKDAFELLKSPKSNRFKSAIPNNVTLENAEFSGGVMCIKLSSQYAKIPPVERSLMNACITHTLCSITGIEQVFISCDGLSPTLYSPENFVTNKLYAHYSTQSINLYFADSDFKDLICETTTVSVSDNESIQSVAISNLIAGPKTSTAQSAIPDGTKLNDIYVEDGVCIINLSHEFVDNANHSETSEAVTLFSIVNTMTELPLVNSVKFLIDGKSGYGFTYFDISEPLTNSSDIFK